MGVATYLCPWEMPRDGEGKGDGGVHVCPGDVSDGIDHHGDNKSSGDRGPELWHQARVALAQGSRATSDKHKHESGNHLRNHLKRDK